MNIYHLKYFADAARLKSVSRSAEINFVSHSAVSQAIKSLEEHFEVSLIFHSKRLFQLTSEGELCLFEAEKLLLQLDLIKENLQKNQNVVQGHLNIWAPQSLIVDSIYKTLSVYQRKYPKVQISIKPGAAAQVRQAILNGEGHIGLMIDDGHSAEFQTTTISSGNFVVVSKNKENLQATSTLIVTSKDKIEVQHLARNFKSKFKTSLKIKMEVMSWGVIKNLIEKNFGLGYVPDYCVQKELDSGKLFKADLIGKAFKYEIKAIWPIHKQLLPNAQLFVDLLKAECR